MKLAIIAGAAIAAGAAALATQGHAQTVPNGSYLQSCRNIQVQDGPGDADLLLADCRDSSGRWNSTGLRFRGCRGDIGNRDGQLVCGGGYGARDFPDRDFPDRGYQDRGYQDRGYQDRGYQDRGAPGGGYPGYGGYGGYGGDRGYSDNRPYRGTLRLHQEYELRGPVYEVTREVTNLPRQFNDKAVSISVTGGGTWQVCSDSDFRGRCITVTGNIPDLRRYGLAEAITSIRQIRR